MLNIKALLKLLILNIFGAAPSRTADAPPNNTTTSQTTQTDKCWRIIHDDAGFYYVELYLNEAAPIRDSEPTLFINGKERNATVSPDRKTLRAPLGSLEIEQIKEVITPQQFFARLQRNAKASRTLHSTAPPEHSVKSMAPDPTASPRFDVEVLHYDDGDEALELPDAPDGKKVERRAVVYLPTGTTEPLPVVVFLHGRHQTCFNENGELSTFWPCPPGFKPLPNHEGYSTIATELAGHGYIVVSLSANGICHIEGEVYPSASSRLRGHLILAHLDLLADANNGKRPDLKALEGKLNLTNIGLLGHSRGGDGVSKVIPLNRQLNKGYGIQAALFLGGNNSDYLCTPDTHTAVIHPLLDTDVMTLTSQAILDTSRVAFNDNVLRCNVLLTGANHNYFNSVWSPNNEYPGGVDDALRWGDLIVKQLTQEEQRLLGAFYIAGFFRLTLGKEQQFLPLFDGSSIRTPVLPEAEVRSSAHAPRLNRYDIQLFETLFTDDVALTPGKWTWTLKQGIGDIKNQTSFLDHPRYTHAYFHSFLNFRSVAPSSPAELELHPKEDEPAVDISGYSHLSFYATYQLSDNPNLLVNLDISLGNTEVTTRTQRIALAPVPEIALGIETFLLQQISLPLKDFLIDVSLPVNTLSFTLPEGGNIYLSDIAFTGPIIIETPHPTPLPFVNIKNAYLASAQTDQTLEIEITLSAPSTHKISLYVDIKIFNSISGWLALNAFATFEPEEQITVVKYTIPAGQLKTSNMSADKLHWESTIRVQGLSKALLYREDAILRIPTTPASPKNQ